MSGRPRRAEKHALPRLDGWPEETEPVRECGITTPCRWAMPVCRIIGGLDRGPLWKARTRFGAYAT